MVVSQWRQKNNNDDDEKLEILNQKKGGALCVQWFMWKSGRDTNDIKFRF